MNQQIKHGQKIITMKIMENKHTAMQQLLAQLKDERAKLPMLIEWDRCYQAIEYVIQNTYLPMEKEQMIEAFDEGQEYEYQYHVNSAPKFYSDTYYNETYKQD